MKIAKRGILRGWALGYLSAILLLAVSNGYSVWKLHHLGASTIPELNVDIRIIDHQKRMVDSILSQLRYEQKYLLMRDRVLYDRFLETNSDFHRLLEETGSIANSPAKKDSVRKIGELVGVYESLVNKQTRGVEANSRYDVKLYEAKKDRVSDQVLEELKRLEGYARQDVGRRIDVAGRAGDSAAKIALGAFVITLLTSLLVALLMTRTITRPLTKLVNKTKEISRGIFKSNLKIDSPSEIAELARAFNSMCDKLSEVDRMKNDFLSMISHELRTPLTTIKEGASLLLEKIGGEITQKQERLLSILAHETDRLIVMVNSILDLSKMEAGMMSYTFEPAGVAPLIEQALTEIAPLLEAKKIRLRKDFVDHLQATKVDEMRILQALRNLIANAAKFTPEGGHITVSARKLNGFIEVSVEDSGPGIPEERIPIIFEKFSGSDHKRGTGLGLAIVKHIIDVHGGKVWVESRLEQGSKFTFVLPS